MLINNLELIVPLLCKDSRFFCHLQIVCRAKDHKGEKIKEGAIKTYFITGEEHLRRVMPEIILLCEHYGARAYINVSHKDFSKLQKLLLVKLASLVCEGNIQNPRKTLNSAAGQLTTKNAVWIVDIDDMSVKDDVLKWLDNYLKLDPSLPFCNTREELYLKGIIPTRQGCHLLTSAFNLEEFQKEFPNIDVHKNSMGTLLYYPDSIDYG